MENTREGQIQSIFEKFENIFKSMHKNRAHNIGGIGSRIRETHNRHKGHKFPFEDLNLSRKETIFLFMIAKSKDGVTSKDLAMWMWISPGAVTQFIDNLVAKNLVVREEDPNDRRSMKVTLTDFARSKFESFRKGYMGTVTPFFANLSDSELSQLNTLLEKLHTSAENSRKI